MLVSNGSSVPPLLIELYALCVALGLFWGRCTWRFRDIGQSGSSSHNCCSRSRSPPEDVACRRCLDRSARTGAESDIAQSGISESGPEEQHCVTSSDFGRCHKARTAPQQQAQRDAQGVELDEERRDEDHSTRGMTPGANDDDDREGCR